MRRHLSAAGEAGIGMGAKFGCGRNGCGSQPGASAPESPAGSISSLALTSNEFPCLHDLIPVGLHRRGGRPQGPQPKFPAVRQLAAQQRRPTTNFNARKENHYYNLAGANGVNTRPPRKSILVLVMRKADGARLCHRPAAAALPDRTTHAKLNAP